jgi:hypothetical protein
MWWSVTGRLRLDSYVLLSIFSTLKMERRSYETSVNCRTKWPRITEDGTVPEMSYLIRCTLSCVARDENKPGKYNGVEHENDVIPVEALFQVGQEAVHGQDLLEEVTKHLRPGREQSVCYFFQVFTVHVDSILGCLYRMDVGNVTDV